ncbi:hypothetical protein GCM10025882_33040 [Acinetobacter gyllenbergii]|uniref:Uncharacterized protein n=1 Tax=Acinetobacter gyllenbergii CIP 110306 = MTCC 11365 TaxID=1217657 RepID=A0A829HHM9_9GAMM|nr:hypothetical protein [Acinetobacter gyllenbergii]EPF80435.1 hypothetical protein F957_02095 [Acinetobacter gyllenbergii CIP 110306 = MTCC 11365]EPH34258.1 hypothetical protein L293_3623 [Acinetobacter gyllenbergii CIP 110306 = MTCC 11365]GMA12879.1 hypothetical protein GCM10025882_33040 [Acinetobacter gyllenbergii]
MLSNTIYLWEPEIFTGKVPAEDDSHQVAFELHQQYRHISNHGRTLHAWLDLFSNKICDPQYQSYFSEQTQQWVQGIKSKFAQGLYASVQVDILENEAQNDAVYRVFYEAAHETGIGFYESNYNVWAIGELQSPENAVSNMLQPYLLEPLQVKQLEFAPEVEPAVLVSDFQMPRNMPEAEQLISQWFEQQKDTQYLKLDVFNVAHDFISNWGNIGRPELALDTGYRCFLLTQKQLGVFYQIKMVLRKLTVSPMLSFAMDFTDRFIPEQLQEQLSERLIFRLRSMDIHKNTGQKNNSELCFALTGRWDSQADIQDFFKNLDAYIDFIFTNLGQGRLEVLQAWAYGEMPADFKIDLDFRFELMMIALSQDLAYLKQRYQYHKAVLMQNNARASDLGLLEESYKFCQKLIKIVIEAGTGLQPYIPK